MKEEKDAAEATLHQLREEMALLRRKVAQIEGQVAWFHWPNAIAL